MTADMPSRKDQMDAQFGRAAAMYAVSEHRAGSDLDTMVRLADLSGDERVLDLATGAGHTALAFAPHVAHVVVTDLADGMVDKARELFADAGRTNATFEVVDVQSLPYDDASFDVVTCRIAPHHFLDIHGATAEVSRVLKPGGRHVVVDSMSPEDPEAAAFLDDAERLRDRTHVRSYSQTEWVEIMERASLTVEAVEFHRKRRGFDFWLDRGGAEGETAERLSKMFRAATPAIRDAFEIELDGDDVVAFTDDKIVLLARKPTETRPAG